MSPGRAINCNHVQDLLDDYRRGKLLPGQRQMITDHLQICDTCAAELESRDAIARQMVTALPAAVAPTGLSPLVRSAITAAARQRDPQPRRQRSALLPMMLTAAAVFILAVAMFQLKQPATTRPAVIATNYETAPVDRQLHSETEVKAISDRAARETASRVDAESASVPQTALGAERAQVAGVHPEAEGQAMALADATADKQYFAAPPAAAPPPPDAPVLAGAVQESQPLPAEGAMARRQSFAGAVAPAQAVQSRYTAQDLAAPGQNAAQKAETLEASTARPVAPPMAEAAQATKPAEERKLKFFAKEAPSTTAALSTSTLATSIPALNTTATATATSTTTTSREGAHQ